jgi:hypothetical protein
MLERIPDLPTALGHLKKLNDDGISPNSTTYSIIIEGIFQEKCSDDIFTFFNSIPTCYISHRQLFFVITYLLNQNNISAATSLLINNEFVDYSLSHLILQTILLQGTFDATSFTQVQIYMDRHSIETAGHLFTMFRIAKKFILPILIESIEKKMSLIDMNLEHAAQNIYLLDLLDERQLKKAQEVIKSLLCNDEFIVMSCVYHRFIEIAAELGENNTLQVSFMRLNEERLSPKNDSFLIALGSFAKSRNDERCVSIIKQISRRGINITAEHYYHLIDVHCNRGSVVLAKDDIKAMLDEGIRPNARIYNRIIKSFLDQFEVLPKPNFQRAFQTLIEMVNGVKISPNDDTFLIFTLGLNLATDSDFRKSKSEEW